MSEPLLSKPSDSLQPDLVRIYRLVEQLNAQYQETRVERQHLAQWEDEQEFSILGEIELFATQIHGYASQVLSQNFRSTIDTIIQHLKTLKLFEIDYFSTWYFTKGNEYPQIKRYVESQDYLRLLLIEYLNQSLPLQSVLL